MVKLSVRWLVGAFLAGAWLSAGTAYGQEKAQKGVSVGALERHSQNQTQGQDLLSVQQQLKRRDDSRPALSPQQMTDMFLRLDHNHDLRLSRAELQSLPSLRARFASFDADGDHRLTYSEFADYADTAVDELASSKL